MFLPQCREAMAKTNMNTMKICYYILFVQVGYSLWLCSIDYNST